LAFNYDNQGGEEKVPGRRKNFHLLTTESGQTQQVRIDTLRPGKHTESIEQYVSPGKGAAPCPGRSQAPGDSE